MQRNSMNQDNDRIGSNGYRQMNRGYENDQERDSNRSFGGYNDNQHGIYGEDRYRRDESGYGGSSYSGYRGTDDRHQRSYGYDDRGFSGGYGGSNEERHPHDEHERGRWGQDYADQRGHRYEGGMIDDSDRYRRREDDFQRSGYQSHGFYDRNRSGVYQDRDERGRFNDTGEGPSYRRGYTGGDGHEHSRRLEHDDRGRFGGHDGPARGGFESRMDREDRHDRGDRAGRNRYASDDSRRYGHPGYGYENQNRDYGRGGYGRDDRRFDEQRGMGGTVASDRFGRNDHDSDRRWTGGGYEEDRRGRGRGRY